MEPVTMLYLTRALDSRPVPGATMAPEYAETPDAAAALLDAMCRRTCDECRGPISWASRTILTHGSTIDHQTMYLTVVCPLCLPTVATRLSVR
jgi:hypothetical protein